MEFIETGIEGLFLLKPKIFGDDRGFFMEAYNERVFRQRGLSYRWLQDNMAKSQYGVVRGLHFQMPPYSQAKLVRVSSGRVLDVVVDLRKQSNSYGEVYCQELSDENQYQLLIPAGFAHGYSVLSESAVFFYKCDQFYSSEHDAGIRLDDPALDIDWRVPVLERIMSSKDQNLPFLSQIVSPF